MDTFLIWTNIFRTIRINFDTKNRASYMTFWAVSLFSKLFLKGIFKYVLYFFKFYFDFRYFAYENFSWIISRGYIRSWFVCFSNQLFSFVYFVCFAVSETNSARVYSKQICILFKTNYLAWDILHKLFFLGRLKSIFHNASTDFQFCTLLKFLRFRFTIKTGFLGNYRI